jgi:hypothetical protein
MGILIVHHHVLHNWNAHFYYKELLGFWTSSSRNSEIPCVIHHCHNPPETTFYYVLISVGVAFASSCTPCGAGTYSQGGARSCLECPENHFSEREAHSCTPCNNITEFSPRASPTCLTRRLCVHSDYYETRTQCDSNNQVIYLTSLFQHNN